MPNVTTYAICPTHDNRIVAILCKFDIGEIEKIDITAAYHNLTRNLAAVVMAAAVAQGERERIDPVAVVKSAASSLTEEQRVAIVEAVEDGRCSECYGPDPHCQCWNDE